MEAIVLAGGLGTRLKSVVQDLPKPMAPIGSRPFLELLLEFLGRHGFCRVILSVGYRAESIIEYFGECFGDIELLYKVEESPLGTGGAVRLALSACRESHVYVFNGDTFLDLDIAAVEALWQRNRRPIIVGRSVEDTARYGRLSIEEGRVVGFDEKGAAGSGVINGGTYVLNHGQLDDFPPNKPFSLESDYLATAVGATSFDVFVTTARFIDIGVPEDYARAQIELADLL